MLTDSQAPIDVTDIHRCVSGKAAISGPNWRIDRFTRRKNERQGSLDFSNRACEQPYSSGIRVDHASRIEYRLRCVLISGFRKSYRDFVSTSSLDFLKLS